MVRAQLGHGLAEPVQGHVQRVAMPQRMVLRRAPHLAVEDLGGDGLSATVDEAGEEGTGDGPALHHRVARADGHVRQVDDHVGLGRGRPAQTEEGELGGETGGQLVIAAAAERAAEDELEADRTSRAAARQGISDQAVGL